MLQENNKKQENHQKAQKTTKVDMTDFSDTSSGLQLLNQASTSMPCNDGNERQIYRQQKKQVSHQKSSIEISIDALLGELSDIKAENGIIGDSSEP